MELWSCGKWNFKFTIRPGFNIITVVVLSHHSLTIYIYIFFFHYFSRYLWGQLCLWWSFWWMIYIPHEIKPRTYIASEEGTLHEKCALPDSTTSNLAKLLRGMHGRRKLCGPTWTRLRVICIQWQCRYSIMNKQQGITVLSLGWQWRRPNVLIYGIVKSHMQKLKICIKKVILRSSLDPAADFGYPSIICCKFLEGLKFAFLFAFQQFLSTLPSCSSRKYAELVSM